MDESEEGVLRGTGCEFDVHRDAAAPVTQCVHRRQAYILLVRMCTPRTGNIQSQPGQDTERGR